MKFWTRIRSAVTGKFVRREEAEKHPNTTVSERVVFPDTGSNSETVTVDSHTLPIDSNIISDDDAEE